MTRTPDPFHVDVARIALAAAEPEGFALGGGHALLAHGAVHRPTEDIDLFTDRDGGVRAGTALVAEALRRAGLSVASEPGPGIADLFYSMDDAFVEFDVSAGEATVRLSLARLPRQHTPVRMDVGPVLDIEDLLGPKTCALIVRGEVRDYIDVAAAVGLGYDRRRLMDLARCHDSGLADDDLAQAMVRLDSLPDDAFARYGLDPAAVAAMRSRFADWPRIAPGGE